MAWPIEEEPEVEVKEDNMVGPQLVRIEGNYHYHDSESSPSHSGGITSSDEEEAAEAQDEDEEHEEAGNDLDYRIANNIHVRSSGVLPQMSMITTSITIPSGLISEGIILKAFAEPHSHQHSTRPVPVVYNADVNDRACATAWALAGD